jgi:hypothetical protein
MKNPATTMALIFFGILILLIIVDNLRRDSASVAEWLRLHRQRKTDWFKGLFLTRWFGAWCKTLPYKSWRTTTLGIASILFGLWLMKITYVPGQTLYFNLVYVWPAEFGLILAGVALIHTRDHKCKTK